MKRANRLWIAGLCAISCILGTAKWFHTRPIYAQQNTGTYDDGNLYITASVDVDSNYNLYVSSYMEVEFGEYEDIDYIEVDGSADQDGSYIGDDSAQGDDYNSAAFSLPSNSPVPPGTNTGSGPTATPVTTMGKANATICNL